MERIITEKIIKNGIKVTEIETKPSVSSSVKPKEILSENRTYDDLNNKYSAAQAGLRLKSLQIAIMCYGSDSNLLELYEVAENLWRWGIGTRDK